MRTYSLYLSTASAVRAPLNAANLANVTWNINWHEVFGYKTGQCNVRVRLVSDSAGSQTWTNWIGSLRANFASNSSNVTNGLVLGLVRPQNDPVTSTNTVLEVDTLNATGPTMNIPSNNGTLVISLLTKSDALMASVPNYTLWLLFDVEDDEEE